MAKRLRQPPKFEQVTVESVTVRPNSPRQVDFFATTAYEALYGGASGGGKGLTPQEPILTPFGWRQLKDLSVGSVVCAPDGSATKIIAYHKRGIQPLFKIKFHDGSEIICDADHLWVGWESREGRKINNKRITGQNGMRKWTTTSIFEHYKKNKQRIGIPTISAPVCFNVAGQLKGKSNFIKRPLAPYTLGVLLGDGCISKRGNATFFTKDTEIVEHINLELNTEIRYYPHNPGVYRIPTRIVGKPLSDLDLWGKKAATKHIPRQYLFAPESDRWLILQGLMDTDGWCEEDGCCFFSTISKRLANDVTHLARSLGAIVTCSSRIPTFTYKNEKKNGQLSYTLRIKIKKPERLFSISRKRDRCINKEIQSMARWIESIEPAGRGESICITVEHPSSLFIAHDFIVTHNSWSLVIDPLRYVEYTDFTATIFRRTYPQLLNSIIPYCVKYYPHAGGVWNEQKKTWTFPSGAKIRLAYMEHEDDWQNFQGDETCGQYFDELTTFHWKQYQMLGAWNRSRVPGIPPYRRSSSNPGGLAHSAVKRHFVDTCPPVKDGPERYSEIAGMWWQPMKPGPVQWFTNEVGQKLSRVFIPAKVFDNEDLLINNPNYLGQLLQLPPYRRKAYLDGDWDIFEGMFFDMFNREVHVIEPLSKNLIKSTPVSAIRGAIDYGERTVLEVGLRDYEGNIIAFAECYSTAKTPTERAELIAETLLQYDLHNIMIRHDTNMSYSLKHYTGYDKEPITIFREVLKKKMKSKEPTLVEVSKKSEEAVKYRIACNEAVKEFLRFEKDPKTGDFILRPRLFFTSDCKQLIETLPELIHDPDSPGGLDFDKDSGIDDPFDALKYFFMDLQKPIRAGQKKKYKDLDDYMENEVFKPIHDRTLNFQSSTRWDKI